MTVTELPRIRLAHQGDESTLLDMIDLLHPESGLRDGDDKPYPLDQEKCREAIYAATATDKMLYYAPTWIGMATCSGDLAGSVCLQVTAPWYSRQEFMFDLWNFVMPAYRKSKVADMLIDFALSVGDSLGLDVVMGVMSTERAPAKMRFYQRKIGVLPFGGFFLYSAKKKAR